MLGKVVLMPILTDGVLELRPLNRDHIELLRVWRNACRLSFFDQHIILPAEQQAWYNEHYLKDAADLMWIAYWLGDPIGTGALTHVDFQEKEAEWGRLMIGEMAARGKGFGQRIAMMVRDFGLDVLELERLYASLWTTNKESLHTHIAAGYLPYTVEGAVTHVELHRKDWR